MKANEFKFLDPDGREIPAPRKRQKPTPPHLRLGPDGKLPWGTRFRMLCERYGMNPNTVRRRMEKQGMGLRKAIRTPLIGKVARGKGKTLQGHDAHHGHYWRQAAAVGAEGKLARKSRPIKARN